MKFKVTFVRIAVVTFLIGCLFMIWGMPDKSSSMDYFNSNSEYVISSLLEEINNKQELQKDKVDKTLNNFNDTNKNGLYYVKIKESNSLKYEYKKEVAADSIKFGYDRKITKDSWEIYYKKTDLQQEKDKDSILKTIDSNLKPGNILFQKIADVFIVDSLFVLGMAVYVYMGGKNKFIFAIAALDFAVVGWIIASMYFLNLMKIGTVLIWIGCLLAFTVFKIYFIRKNVLFEKV